MIAFLNALGGVALILFGVRFLRKGLDKLVGPRLSLWIGRLLGGPVRTAGVGIGLGMISPSSSSQGLISVSLVRDGMVTPARAVLLLMGGYVGSTLLLHIVAADLVEYAPIGVLVGVLLFQGTGSSRSRGTGQIIIALALILLGVGIVGRVSSEMEHARDAQELARLASGHPVFAAVLAMAAAAMFQSSTAALAVVIGLALQDDSFATGSLTVACVAGANIGITSIAVLSGWSDPPARRFALVVLTIRAAVAVVVLAMLPVLVGLVESIPASGAQRVAICHTGFNLAALVIALPAAGWLTGLMERMIRPRPNGNILEPNPIDPRYAEDPGIAFVQTKREIMLAVRVTASMLRDAWTALADRDEAALREIRQRDTTVDRLERHVKAFLTQQLTNELDAMNVRRRVLQLRFVGDLEAVADIIDKRICETAIRATRRGVRFSESGWEELRGLFMTVCDVIELAGAAFSEESVELADRLLKMKDEVRDEELHLREQHYKRLQDGHKESIETTGLHLEMLGELKHIAHVVAGVAYGVTEIAEIKEKH
ncbi:MAG TPA: Na/Pi cotransporter family protein [Phycisphaerales bacterium]|nr:Na/Pi cotransporter family protein [Phycisphaerales bacterium]